MEIKPADVLPEFFLLLAVAPGYIAVFFWALTAKFQGVRTDFETLLQSFATSLAIQLVFSPITIVWLGYYWRRNSLPQHVGDIVVWVAIVAIIAPVLGGIVVGKYRERVEAPTAWDSFFEEFPPPARSFLVLEMKNGKRVAGVWTENSRAKFSPNPPGLFLEQEWTVDWGGRPKELVKSTAGILIPAGNEVLTIRVLEAPPDPP